jgi:predicted DNA binding protein
MTTNNPLSSNSITIFDLSDLKSENIVYTYKNEYHIDGMNNFDFFNELNKDDEEDSEINSKDDNYETKQNFRCLITGEPLSEPIITMPCGHKFNYIPLYHDLVSYILLSNKLYKSNNTTKYPLRCPYCRSTSKDLLPFYNMDNVIYNPDIHSHPDSQMFEFDILYNTVIPKIKYYRCEFIYENPYYNKDKSNSCTNRRTLRCGSCYYNTKHITNINKSVIKGYCSYHRKNMKHSLKNDMVLMENTVISKTNDVSFIVNSEFDELNEYKEGQVIQLQNQNQNQNQNQPFIEINPLPQTTPEIEEKKYSPTELKAIQKAYISLKKKDSEKTTEDLEKQGEYMQLITTISVVTLLNIDCIEIMKKGKRKGEMCNCHVYLDFMCKRHYRDYLKKTFVE